MPNRLLRIVGRVLLAVLPGLCALKLNFSFRKTLFAVVGFSILSTTVGIMVSAAFNVVTAGVIVFVLVLFFLLTLLYKKMS